MRRLLVQCAHYILGPFGRDSDLRRWGLRLVGSSGKKRAITAVARKLAVLMHSLWRTGEIYEPFDSRMHWSLPSKQERGPTPTGMER